MGGCHATPREALIVSFDSQLLRAVERAVRLLKEGARLELPRQKGHTQTGLQWKVLVPVFARIGRQLRESAFVQKLQQERVQEQHRKDHLVWQEKEHQINHLVQAGTVMGPVQVDQIVHQWQEWESNQTARLQLGRELTHQTNLP